MGHSVDPGYRQLASRYLRRQVKQLADQLDGVRAAEDIEFVHRARVATRRLRAALRMFDDCFPARRVKRWRKAIRHITGELGDARDCDVQIDYLCGVLSAATSKDCFPGIARLLVRLERERERLQGRVVEALRHLQAAGVLHEIQQMTKQMPPIAGTPKRMALPSSASYERFEKHISRRWNELSEKQTCLADADDHHAHHAMRIAAKRLRYLVEIAKPIYAGQLDAAVDAVKKVQSLLGEIHDCDVWLTNLERFAAKEKSRIMSLFGHIGPFIRLKAGIDYLHAERQTYRHRIFDELVAFWEDLQRQQFGEHLIATVQQPYGLQEGLELPLEMEIPPENADLSLGDESSLHQEVENPSHTETEPLEDPFDSTMGRGGTD
jgi:CHAD domain-containing protein